MKNITLLPVRLARLTSSLMSSLKITIPAVLLLVASLSSQSFGQVIVSGDFSAGTGQVQISQDITFTITSTDTFTDLVIAFDELVGTSDGSQDNTYLTNSGILMSINGASNTTLTGTSLEFFDNLNGSSGDLTAADSYIYIANTSFNVMTGDSVVVRAQTFSQTGTVAGFNPNVAGTFTGDVFLAEALFSSRISSNGVAVPEPSTYTAIAGLAVLGLAVWRRRRAA